MTIIYRLNPHAVSYKFVKLIRKILTSTKPEVRYTAWAVYPEGDKCNQVVHDILRQNVKYFDENNELGLKVEVPVPELMDITFEKLNKLHGEFERLITKTFEVIKIAPLKLNL